MVCKDYLLNVLKQNIAPALGCTEPVAIALATANLRSLLNDNFESIDVKLSQNILKNAMGVGIPGTNEIGISLAVALGAIVGRPELKLEVLRDVCEADVVKAKSMVEKQIINVSLADNDELLWIEVLAKGNNHIAKAVIQGKHTNLLLVELDGKRIVSGERIVSEEIKNDPRKKIKICDIYSIVNEMSEEDLSFLEEVIEKNYKIAKYGIEHYSGYGIAASMQKNIEKGYLGCDLVNYATMMTVAGSEARMSGCPLPAMSNSGSGNQGITLTCPIIAISEKLKIDKLRTYRALAISHLVSIHVKSYFGILSALCGIVNASMGVACGTVYLLGGNNQNMVNAIQCIIGDISGMLCDGAKLGCSLKVATGVRTAVNSALYGMSEICVHEYEGINCNDIETSFKNLGEIVHGGMMEVDKSILNVMVHKFDK